MRRKKPKALKIRRKWAINPKTRIKKSIKIYSRKREKKEIIRVKKGKEE